MREQYKQQTVVVLSVILPAQNKNLKTKWTRQKYTGESNANFIQKEHRRPDYLSINGTHSLVVGSKPNYQTGGLKASDVIQPKKQKKAIHILQWLKDHYKVDTISVTIQAWCQNLTWKVHKSLFFFFYICQLEMKTTCSVQVKIKRKVPTHLTNGK